MGISEAGVNGAESSVQRCWGLEKIIEITHNTRDLGVAVLKTADRPTVLTGVAIK